jgi:hypothetical protein
MDKYVAKLKINIEWSSVVLKPTEYVEKSRSLLWKKAFPFYLSENASPRFLKCSEFLKIDGGILAGRLFYLTSCVIQCSLCLYHAY